jgi:hypothetical protein
MLQDRQEAGNSRAHRQACRGSQHGLNPLVTQQATCRWSRSRHFECFSHPTTHPVVVPQKLSPNISQCQIAQLRLAEVLLVLSNEASCIIPTAG